jgi:tRNA dimethylallyltransferase
VLKLKFGLRDEGYATRIEELIGRLYILTGPTAVGKTQLALDWAQRFDAEIVSCDSLLVYRGMDLGTAKPTMEERSRVPHHGIDLVEPWQAYHVGAYLEEAARAVRDILGRGRRVLVTGGSGFYLKGFTAPVVDELVIPDAVEERVERIRMEQGLPGLVRVLREVSPEDYRLVDLCNERRVVPALKRCLASGLGIEALRRQMEELDFPFKGFEVCAVLLQRGEAALKERIARRTRLMLERGLVEEVRALLVRGIERNPSACGSIGYREVIACLRGQLAWDQLESQINTATWNLVKKQQKWFRHQIQFDRIVDLDVDTMDLDGLFPGVE